MFCLRKPVQLRSPISLVQILKIATVLLAVSTFQVYVAALNSVTSCNDDPFHCLSILYLKVNDSI